MVIVCSSPRVCIGMALAGVESHYCANGEEVSTALAGLDVEDIQLIIMDRKFADTTYWQDFRKTQPHILAFEYEF